MQALLVAIDNLGYSAIPYTAGETLPPNTAVFVSDADVDHLTIYKVLDYVHSCKPTNVLVAGQKEMLLRAVRALPDQLDVFDDETTVMQLSLTLAVCCSGSEVWGSSLVNDVKHAVWKKYKRKYKVK